MINYNQDIPQAEIGLPENSDGDIRFESFEHLKEFYTEEQITVICARFLNNSRASRVSNKKSAAVNAELLRGVKQAAKEMFNKSLKDLSPEEMQAASKAYASK